MLFFFLLALTMSALVTAVSTLRTLCPSMEACSAQMGSTSLTSTLQPMPRREAAQPLPTWRCLGAMLGLKPLS